LPSVSLNRIHFLTGLSIVKSLSGGVKYSSTCLFSDLNLAFDSRKSSKGFDCSILTWISISLLSI